MRKFVVFIIFILFAFSSIQAYSADKCFDVAKRLYELQNQIVDKSFRHLSIGTWAKYGESSKAVYLGRQISPKTRLKLYVIEFTSGPTSWQIWYKLTPKDVTYQGKRLRFWTLEPMEIYTLIGERVFYISKGMIEAYMRMSGTSWSTILEEGAILNPPDCNNLPEINEKSYNLPNGKKVKATIIRSTVNGSELYCSPDVPFGMIKVVSPNGKVGGIGGPLVDFGTNAKAVISREMVKNSVSLPIFSGMDNTRKPPISFPKAN